MQGRGASRVRIKLWGTFHEGEGDERDVEKVSKAQGKAAQGGPETGFFERTCRLSREGSAWAGRDFESGGSQTVRLGRRSKTFGGDARLKKEGRAEEECWRGKKKLKRELPSTKTHAGGKIE